MSIKEWVIFTDASYDPASQLGVGGKLVLEGSILEEADDRALGALPIGTVFFQNTTASRCELETVLWALESVCEQLPPELTEGNRLKLKLYTDCRNVCDLPARQSRLEASNFISKRSQKPLAQADLYKRFYILLDQLQPEIFWIKGHIAKRKSDVLSRVFARVDQKTRQQLRERISESNTIKVSKASMFNK